MLRRAPRSWSADWSLIKYKPTPFFSKLRVYTWLRPVLVQGSLQLSRWTSGERQVDIGWDVAQGERSITGEPDTPRSGALSEETVCPPLQAYRHCGFTGSWGWGHPFPFSPQSVCRRVLTCVCLRSALPATSCLSCLLSVLSFHRGAFLLG